MNRSTDNQVEQFAKVNEPIIYKKTETPFKSLWELLERYNETPPCILNTEILIKWSETENDRFYHNEMD